MLLSFKLKVEGFDGFEDFTVVSRSYKFRGQVQIRGNGILLEWGGSATVEEVTGLDVRDEKVPLPDESLTVPFNKLYRAEVRKGWLFSRLELQARELKALSMVPSSEAGRVSLWFKRGDRKLATQLAERINAGIASATEDTETPSYPGYDSLAGKD